MDATKIWHEHSGKEINRLVTLQCQKYREWYDNIRITENAYAEYWKKIGEMRQ